MESTQLTSFEVFTWLQARRVVRDLEAKTRPAAGDLQTSHLHPTLASPAVVARNREVKWIEDKTLKFISGCVAAKQSPALLQGILQVSERKAKEWGVSLSRKQHVQILDAQPTTALDLFLCIDECPGLDEDRQGELAAEIAALVALHDETKATFPPSEPVPNVGVKRARSNSSVALSPELIVSVSAFSADAIVIQPPGDSISMTATDPVQATGVAPLAEGVEADDKLIAQQVSTPSIGRREKRVGNLVVQVGKGAGP